MNLDTHILDVVNLIRWEELSDVVLCGHSYGGCVITGAADRTPERIRSLVYLDAFVLEDGENLSQHVPGGLDLRVLDGWPVSPIPAKAFNVNSDDRDWVNRQCTLQPMECFQQRIKLTGGIDKIRNVTFILATGFVNNTPFPPFYEEAKARGWKTLTIFCGHDVMLDQPEELTKILLDSSSQEKGSWMMTCTFLSQNLCVRNVQWSCIATTQGHIFEKRPLLTAK